MTDRLAALRSSVEHLASLIGDVDVPVPESPAFPSDWSIADTMSHLGSGAVIMKANVENVLARRAGTTDFNQSVWDVWNAKSPSDQVTDALVAITTLQEHLESLTEDQRGEFRFVMGPFDLDFDGYVGLRLNEQALHTWDIDVVLDPTATLSDEVAGVIVDDIGTIVRLAGAAHGEEKVVRVRTSAPARDLALIFSGDAIELQEARHSDEIDVRISSEAFIRLVYGRLASVPDSFADDREQIESLRTSFPGF